MSNDVISPSRKLFRSMFHERRMNSRKFANNSVFYSLVPSAYKSYYQVYIRRWIDWASGYVPEYHDKEFFSTGMGYTVCDLFSRECMNGGYRFTSKDKVLKQFIESWDSDNLQDIFSRMFFYSNSGGNAILCLTPIDGELYPSVYPIDRVFFEIGRTGKIDKALLFNRFVAGGENCYYARETRTKMNGAFYRKVELSLGGLAQAPSWGNQSFKKVPEEIQAQWNYNFGASIQPGVWYKMPEKFNTIGLYNVRNKSVAVILSDMPGYSDSTLSTALDVLYSIDYNFTQSQVDMYLGRGRVMVPKTMQNVYVNQPGTLSNGMSFQEAVELAEAPLDETFYSEYPSNALDGSQPQPIFIQPDLRGEAHKFIRDAELELLASKVGISAKDLANHLTKGYAKTATEAVQEQGTTEKSVANKRALANVAINDMLKDVATFYGFEEEITIEWGREGGTSVTERHGYVELVQAGLMTTLDFLRKEWVDLSEEEIQKKYKELVAERERDHIVAMKNWQPTYQGDKREQELMSGHKIQIASDGTVLSD